MLIFQVCATGVSLSELLSALFFLTAVLIYFPQNKFSNQNIGKRKGGKEKKEEIEEEKVTKKKQGIISISLSCQKLIQIIEHKMMKRFESLQNDHKVV